MPSISITELREKAAQKAMEARARFDEIGDQTTEERKAQLGTEFDAFMKEHDDLTAQADRQERLEAAEKRAADGDNRRPVPPNGSADLGGEERSGDGGGEGDVEYRAAFEQYLRRGIGACSEEQRAALEARFDASPELRAQASGTDTAGGFLVPTLMSTRINEAMAAWGPMWDGDVVSELNTTTGAALNHPTEDDTGQSGETVAENTEHTSDGTHDFVYGNVVFNAYVRGSGIVKIPNQLLTDSAWDFEAMLPQRFAKRLGRGANALLTTGTGSNQPRGIVTAAGAGVTAAAVAAITFDEVINLYHSVDPAYRQSPKCRWQFNDNTLSALRKLKDGQGNYLWQKGDVRQGEPDLLNGKPYSINMAMADPAASARPIIFGDHAAYMVRKVADIPLIILRERYAENFQTGFVAIRRFDGDMLDAAAIKAMTMAAS